MTAGNTHMDQDGMVQVSQDETEYEAEHDAKMQIEDATIEMSTIHI